MEGARFPWPSIRGTGDSRRPLGIGALFVLFAPSGWSRSPGARTSPTARPGSILTVLPWTSDGGRCAPPRSEALPWGGRCVRQVAEQQFGSVPGRGDVGVDPAGREVGQ